MIQAWHDGDDSLRGNLDRIALSLDGSLEVAGWAVDPLSPGGGHTPVTVAVDVDGKEMFSGVANNSRPGECARVAPTLWWGPPAHRAFAAGMCPCLFLSRALAQNSLKSCATPATCMCAPPSSLTLTHFRSLCARSC